MVRNILIGLDGSADANTAVDLAVRWARRTQAELVGVGVVDEATIRSVESASFETYRHVLRAELRLQDARSRVASYLQQFTRRCAEAGVTGRAVERVGIPAEQILAEADDCDLTVLGRRSYFRFATQATADDTLREVLRHTRRPVVAVGGRLPEQGSVVVVAYDGSPGAARALEAFQQSGLEDWQAVRVVSAAPDAAEADRRAADAARFLSHHGIAAEARPLPASGPVAALLREQVAELRAGMLVMGAYGRPAYAEALFGSTTDGVLAEGDAVLFLHH